MKRFLLLGVSLLVLMSLIACTGETAQSDSQANDDVADENDGNEHDVDHTEVPAHEDLHQEPVPVEVERAGENEVDVKMTAQITDMDIAPEETYQAWTFNGEAPGPLVVVDEGDTINFTLENHDPAVPHSMDFHAVSTAPSENFEDVMPEEDGSWSYTANSPGVFMYHCATASELQHIANGMHGTLIVRPDDGYPNDDEVDREFVLTQNEWYDHNDLDDMIEGRPNYVTFANKSFDEDLNTNGTETALSEEPLTAQVGDTIRMYVNNLGPNEVSSFHVIGTTLDHVYADGNPYNHEIGLQTVMLPASGGTVVEFTVEEEGEYPFVTHQFNHVEKGGVGVLEVVSEDEEIDDDGRLITDYEF